MDVFFLKKTGGLGYLKKVFLNPAAIKDLQ